MRLYRVDFKYPVDAPSIYVLADSLAQAEKVALENQGIYYVASRVTLLADNDVPQSDRVVLSLTQKDEPADSGRMVAKTKYWPKN